MAATESATRNAAALFAAAAAAVAATPLAARAENTPKAGSVAVKDLSYEDSQPGIKRISVSAPSLLLTLPLGSAWSLDASVVRDAVSGASPRYHAFTDIRKYPTSGASRMQDERTAADVKVTRYFSRSAVSLSYAHSSENDYVSNALATELRFSSDDNNRTWTFGVGGNTDRINPTNGGVRNVRDESKKVAEGLIGLTQVLTPKDIAQVNLSYSRGNGYYSDPYKIFDNRPRNRRSVVLLARWNHYFEQVAATMRTSYRSYRDSFGVQSHTATLEWVQTAGRWTIAPNVRLYSQSAADFYFDPIIGPNGPDALATLQYGQTLQGFTSADQRLSAFGAVTVGLKVGVQLDKSWSADLKAERYEQRANWRVGGNGSPGLDPFRANVMQFGIASKF